MIYRRVVLPLLSRVDPERVHEATIALGEFAGRIPLLGGIAGGVFARRDPALEREVLGIRFANPVGLAAGFDKNGRLTRAARAVGFGFVEVGSVSARPWSGNPRPRIFRLPADRALVNRVGLPSEGADRVAARLAAARARGISIGVNLVKTADPGILGDAAVGDFVASYRILAPAASFVVLNVSCPNTADGRSFEEIEPLARLLDAISSEARSLLRRVPLLVKFSSDLTSRELATRVELALARDVSGFVLCNSSSARPDSLATGPEAIRAAGSGGLTGLPLLENVLDRVRVARGILGEGRGAVIGVGGIQGPDDALRVLDAGADLIEVYTGLVYEGPFLVRRILDGIRQPRP